MVVPVMPRKVWNGELTALDNSNGDGDEDDDEMLPPHEIVARGSAPLKGTYLDLVYSLSQPLRVKPPNLFIDSVATLQPHLSPPEYLQEGNLTQEYEELLSSLPKEKAWVVSNFYQYQGFWHTSRQLQGVLACQQFFKAQDTDILLVTTPKSGTTWLKAILFSLVYRTRYSNTKQHPLLANSPHDLVPFLELKLYVDKQVPDFSCSASPRLFPSHLPFFSLPESVKSSECKLVYLCRNPMDTFVSLWHFTNKLRPESLGPNSFEDVFDRFCRGVSLYGPFWDHVSGYWKESLEKPHKVFFLKYEEMKEKPGVHLRRLAEFLGCPITAEDEASGVVGEILKLCSFDNLSNLEVNKSGKLSSGEENRAFFRRGEAGDWKNFLTAEMAYRLDQISEQKLSKYGLKF
ncbi:cytosolic sulfotransferase 12-like [Actinidia eriantha]|uniref:cytosolic sulfotransferase 12-like n=1 Tax=Actinidia eriantha TaxID=165200 RepID=UPI00258C90FA|nr:cytosolic sulfotransferase 12-like [Actinidia eriantha]